MPDKRYGYYITALERTSEPIRNTKWLANFDFSEFSSASKFPNTEILSLHVKDVDIPSIQSAIDSFFYHGFERKLPASVDNAGTITMTILEGENLIGYNSILRWNQACSNGGQLSIGETTLIDNPLNSEFALNAPDYDSGEFSNRNAINIQCFSYATGAEILKINFLNIKPTKIGSVKLAYDGNELYKYVVTFDFDLAIFKKPGTVSNRVVIPRESEI